MVTLLDFCKFSSSTVAVCVSTCSSEDSRVCSVVTVADKGSVTECADSEDFSTGNFTMQTSVVTISLFAINARFLHCTIFLLVTLFETN